jgi:N-acetylglucosamine-6-phosphate deacetylase
MAGEKASIGGGPLGGSHGFLLKGGKVFVDDNFVDADVLIEGGKIKAIGSNLQALSSKRVLNCEDRTVCPGFIDIHCHGAVGRDAMDGCDAIEAIGRFKAHEGTTGFLPTIITNPIERMRWAGIQAKIAMNLPVTGAKALGVHIEGPFVAPHHKGALPEQDILLPNLYEIQLFLTELDEAARMVTIAPELPGAESIIKLLSKKNIVVCAGHTDCGYTRMLQAINWGVTNLSHTFNAMRGIHHREPGLIAAALDDERVYMDFICDLIHVHEWILKFFIKAKGPDRCILITDAITAAGMPEGEYTLGGQYVTVSGREPRLIDGTLAGSVLTMIRGVRNLAEKVGLGLPTALRMASANPAKLLGIFDKKGSLAADKDADICILDNRLRVTHTLVEGNLVYEAGVTEEVRPVTDRTRSSEDKNGKTQ